MSIFLNPAADRARVAPPSTAARAFHEALDGYAPTPLRDLTPLGLSGVVLKDESQRLGLPAFKVLGVSWAVERALAEHPATHTLIAASAGNHGRAVAHVARMRGLAARIYLPARSAPARRAAIAAEAAEVVVVDGGYEEAVAIAAAEGAKPGCLELADVGASAAAHRVVDGYATLFAEIGDALDTIVVPAGVGSLAAAAARHGAAIGARVIAVEPETAACVTASLEAGEPVRIATPGTSMAGLDCAEVSIAAWPDLLHGLHSTVTVSDAQAHAAMRELAAIGLRIGDCGAAPLAALRAGAPATGRTVLIATEGPTDPPAYAAVIGIKGS